MTFYYVLKSEGKVRRVAKIVDNALAYGWENGRWVSMPNLLKIQNDVSSDYEKITKEEADQFIKGDSA